MGLIYNGLQRIFLEVFCLYFSFRTRNMKKDCKTSFSEWTYGKENAKARIAPNG